MGPDIAPALTVGDPAPDLTLKPDSGPALALAKPAKGRGPLVVLVVESGCTRACADLLNTLTAEWPTLRALKPQVVLVTAADAAGRAELASKDGPPRVIVGDADGAIAGALGIVRSAADALPAVLVFDGTGRVRVAARQLR